MLTSDEKASEKGQGEQKRDSVYDFLYYDKQRVGAFLAQFDDSGHLQQIKASEHASKVTRRGFKVNLSGDATVLGTGGQGGLGFERGPHQEGSEASERVYDPLWTNALTFLDYLDAADLICRDITKGRLGQFVLVSGSLIVLNAGLLSSLWKTNALTGTTQKWVKNQKAIWNADPKNAALPNKARGDAEKAFVANQEHSFKVALEILPTFPHSSQCTVSGNNFVVWSSLATEGMVGTVSDLSLKHGTDVPGTWSLLGILDALPSPIPPAKPFPDNDSTSPFESLIKNFSNLARTALGRPEKAFGMTALLLFREVLAGSASEYRAPTT
jgi:hypothetical protein